MVEPTTATTTLGMMSAMSEEYDDSRVRPSPKRAARAASPHAAVAGSTRDGWVTRSQNFASANGPDTSAPTRSGIWPKTMLTATPVRKPIITEWGTNRT